MKQFTFAKAGMPAMALAFIMAAALAGCPLESDPEPQTPGEPVPDTIRYDGIGPYLSAKPANTAASPYTVKVAPVNIRENGVMGAINQGAGGRYVIVDLSACSATDNTITGVWETPGVNDMNVIKDNQYIVGVILPDSLTAIGSSAFEKCIRLTAVTIPAGLISIGTDAFYRCSGLTSVDIPAGLISIRANAFSGCSGLTSVTIPAGLISITYGAFSGCAGLTSVTFDGSISPAHFSASGNFPGDLRAKYLTGGPGTYTRPNDGGTWMKQ